MKIKMQMIAAVVLMSGLIAKAPPVGEPAQVLDCSNLSAEVQRFAALLSPANQMSFCGKFSDEMRMQSMQMAAKTNAVGNAIMTPDQAVEQVARDNKLAPGGATPRGCPVK